MSILKQDVIGKKKLTQLNEPGQDIDSHYDGFEDDKPLLARLADIIRSLSGIRTLSSVLDAGV